MYEIYQKLKEEKGVNDRAVSLATGIAPGTLSDWKKGRIKELKAEKLKTLAEYFEVSVEYLMTGQHAEQTSDSGQKYYFSDETAKTAQYIYENKDLRLLFDAARDAEPADLKVVHDMLLALKRKEKGNE